LTERRPATMSGLEGFFASPRQKCIDGVMMFIRRRDDTKVRSDDVQICSKIIAHAMDDRAFEHCDDQGRRTLQPIDELQDLRHQLLIREDLVHEADAMCFSGVNEIAGQKHFESVRDANQSWKKMS